ncbi:MAG: HEAT repeat domain-containing protein [Planctomycetales bacterium]|nr:HEAT repeat domain-containing protein [Planctomycetales bacterium]
MQDKLPIFGVGSSTSQYFKVRGKCFYLAESGCETLRLLNEIYNLQQNDVAGFWALRARHKLAEIGRHHRTSVVTLVIIHTRDDRMRTIAIWVRGHLGGTFGTSSVATSLKSTDTTLRKAAVRALRRMSAYAHLDQVSKSDPDPRIRRIATFGAAKPYKERIRKFTRNVKVCEKSGAAQPLVVLRNFQDAPTRLPKSAALIRMILDRIRWLVGR